MDLFEHTAPGFFREMSILQNETHPNIARIAELLHDKTNYYIISEYQFLRM